jgi:hypothetical protein
MTPIHGHGAGYASSLDTKHTSPASPAARDTSPKSRSYKLADVAVHRVSQWALGQSGRLTQEPLFREGFVKDSHARQALEHALQDAAGGMFDTVVDDVLRSLGQAAPGAKTDRFHLQSEALAASLKSRLEREPALQDLLVRLADVDGMPGADRPGRDNRSTVAYNAVAILGLEPAIQRRLASGELNAQQRADLRATKELLADLRMGGSLAALALQAQFRDLKRPEPKTLSSQIDSRLNATSRQAKEAVQSALTDTQQTLKGASIFVGPDWATARARMSDVLRLGAGDALRDFVNHAAAEAVQQGKKGAELAIFMAQKLGAAPIASLVPQDSALGKLLADIQTLVLAQHPTGDAKEFAIPNLLLACGFAEAARSSTALTSGRHRDALKVMAAVAEGMADGRPGALTRWLGPAKTEAVRGAILNGAAQLRPAQAAPSPNEFRRKSESDSSDSSDSSLRKADERVPMPAWHLSNHATFASPLPNLPKPPKRRTPAESKGTGPSTQGFQAAPQAPTSDRNEEARIRRERKSSPGVIFHGAPVKPSQEAVTQAVMDWQAEAGPRTRDAFLASAARDKAFAYLDDCLGGKLDSRASTAINDALKVSEQRINADVVDEILNNFEQGSGNSSLGKLFNSAAARPVMAALREAGGAEFAVDVLLDFCSQRFAKLAENPGPRAQAKGWVLSVVRSAASQSALHGVPAGGWADAKGVQEHCVKVVQKIRGDLKSIVDKAE